MKRIIIYSIYIVLTLLVVGLLYLTIDRLNKKEQLIVEMAYMPDIAFREITQNHDNPIREYIGHSSLCLIQIDPDCFFCREQVKDVLDKYLLFKGTIILLVSSADEEQLTKYKRQLELHKYPLVKLLYDDKLLFPQTFGTATTPTTVLYSKDGAMLAKYDGLINVEKIIEQLSQDVH